MTLVLSQHVLFLHQYATYQFLVEFVVVHILIVHLGRYVLLFLDFGVAFHPGIISLFRFVLRAFGRVFDTSSVSPV